MKFNKFEMLGEKAGFIVRNIEIGLFLSHKETWKNFAPSMGNLLRKINLTLEF